MGKFAKAKIYLLHDNTNGNNYIGSTTLKETTRLNLHKSHAKKNSPVSSKSIIDNGNYIFKILEEFPCSCKNEIHQKEQYWMDIFSGNLINKRRAFRTKEMKLEKNREYDKKRTRDHKPYLKQYRDYKKSWGGDMRTQNNLLLIDVKILSH